MTKDKNKKTRCPKKYRLTAKKVAQLVGCSESYVKQIRTGAVELDSPLAQKVIAVDKLANEGEELLLKEIERLVKLL